MPQTGSLYAFVSLNLSNGRLCFPPIMVSGKTIKKQAPQCLAEQSIPPLHGENVHDFERSNQSIVFLRRIRLYDKMTVVVNTQP